MSNKKFIVLTNTIFDGWVNCWTDENDRPLVFDSRKEAQAEIDELVEEMGDDPEDYRIEEFK